MTEKTSTKEITSLQDLENFLFTTDNTVNPQILENLLDGVKDIQTRYLHQREEDINKLLISLLQHQRIVVENPSQNLSWFDLDEYKRMIQEMKQDKDRNQINFSELKVYKKPLEIENFSVFKDLEEQQPNFKDVINFYRGSFAMNKTRNDGYIAPRPVLLLGEAGVGKTLFAKNLAKLLKTSFSFYDSNSITSSWFFTGSSPAWKSADIGALFRTMSKCETLSPVIVLDEIDKLKPEQQYSPFSTFHQMLEKENAVRFFDENIRFYFDASNIIYILTANNVNNIPESLLSRMEVFEVPNPDKEQMKVISQNIYQKEINGSSYFSKKLNKQCLDYLSTFRPRDVQKIITRSINTQIANATDLNKTNQALIIDEKEVNKNFMGFV